MIKEVHPGKSEDYNPSNFFRNDTGAMKHQAIEMSNILDELLKNDKPEIPARQTGAIRYEDIKTARVNGKRAVILPGGRMLGKAIDRKLGHSFWTIIGNRTVG